MIGSAICECIHHIAKRTQRLVDQLAFFQCLSLSCSPGLTLATSQVHLQFQPGTAATKQYVMPGLWTGFLLAASLDHEASQ